MGVIKNNPRSILVAWTGIIVVGFVTFVFAKDMVGNERRADNIRRIKQERRSAAYSHFNKNLEDEENAASNRHQ
ncbi:hypothetical protein IWW38_000716 [Coemansia aciculifera]|uniref:Uncharacterized protein n=1 Tax=Coemansia aciculifera TaxID=417176 RepID=A0ACC1M7Z2_9FUNG|nr:hypothetical protein IWW38_000716 [Coemansia aciculifera]